MKYQTLQDTNQLIHELLQRRDLSVSLYLPYGILGESEDKCRIARKNVCDELLRDDRITRDGPLYGRLCELRDEVGKKGIQEQRSTRCLFLGSDGEVDFWLPGTVTPMLAVGQPAVEPLFDYVSSAVESHILVFDLNDVHLLACRERDSNRIDWKVPSYLQPYYDEPECWSLEYVSTIRDKYNERRHLDQTRGGQMGFMGLSSREVSIRDREVFYLARIV